MITRVGVPGCACVCLTYRSSPDIDTATTTPVTHDADTGKVTSTLGKANHFINVIKGKKYIN